MSSLVKRNEVVSRNRKRNRLLLRIRPVCDRGDQLQPLGSIVEAAGSREYADQANILQHRLKQTLTLELLLIFRQSRGRDRILGQDWSGNLGWTVVFLTKLELDSCWREGTAAHDESGDEEPGAFCHATWNLILTEPGILQIEFCYAKWSQTRQEIVSIAPTAQD